MTAAIQPYHLSVEEFAAFCGTDPERYKHFELVEGEIWEPMAEGIAHSDLVEEILAALRRRYRPDRLVRSSGSVQLDGDGLVLPDAYVLRPDASPEGRQYWNGTQLELVVEVSVSTWARDAGGKLRNYARGGVPVYYLVQLEPKGGLPIVHVSSEPVGGRYTRSEVAPIDRLLDP